MADKEPNMDFECLAASPEFGEFSSILRKLTGVPMSLLSPEGEMRMAYGASVNPVCLRLRASKRGLAICNACDMLHNRKAGAKGEALLYKCHIDFLDMIIPIFVQGRHVASISSGQILPEPPNAESFAKLKELLPWLELDGAKVYNAYLSAPHMPKGKAKLVMRLLKTFAVQLCESLRKIRDLETRLERDELRKAKEHVAKCFSDPDLGLVDTAAYAGLSPAHFSHVFKQSLGVSFTRHVQSVRLDEAKRLLRHSEKSISEICFSCGFNSMANFIRVFRSFEKMTPGSFRERAAKLLT